MASLRPLTPELKQIAVSELNEDPEEIDEEINAIHHLIAGDLIQGKYQLTDQFILSFLRSCKYNSRSVRKKLPNYLTMRKISPDIFGDRIVNDKLLAILRTGVHLPLPQSLESDSSIIHISNYGNLNLKQYSIFEGIKLFYMMLEIRFLEEDCTSVAGITSIEDFSDLSFTHMVTMNIGVLKKIMTQVRLGMPYRLKAIHIINAPWFVNGIMGLFRDALPYKMKKRFFIHKKITDLYEHVPQKLLPEEYGGENGSVASIAEQWEKKLKEYKVYFEQVLKFGSDSHYENGQM